MQIDHIEGTIVLSGLDIPGSEGLYSGLNIRFHLDEHIWEQSGATPKQLVAAGTSALLERLQQALALYMLEEGEESPSND